MPDITMCLNEECPECLNCYRYIVKPDKTQSYSDFGYTCNGESGFEDFIKYERNR